jgi:flagellar hook assembly protein FlgD
MGGFIAFPVPYNPKKGVMKIENRGTAVTYGRGEFIVYDVNGDHVFTKSFSSDITFWNGRNTRGEYVKPGLYLIKLEVENDTGKFGKKVIRILVKY